MQDNDRAEFVTVLGATCEMYGKPSPSTMMIKMYFSALTRFSLFDVKHAINRHVQNSDTGQFFPKPADIVREVEGSSETRAEEAWTKVDKAVRMIGPNKSVVFDDHIIHLVLADMGGWIDLCNTGGEEYPFKHNEFVKRYRGTQARPDKMGVNRLIGVEESYNAQKGFNIDPPVLIGDKNKAMFVLENGSEKPPALFHSVGDILGNLKITKE